MFLFIASVIFIIAGAVSFYFMISNKKKAAKGEYEGSRNEKTVGRIAGVIGSCLVGLGILLLLGSSLYRQDVGEALVVTTPGGEIAGTDIDAGFGVKAPWNDLVRYDIRNQVITMAGDGTGENMQGPSITGQTKDGTSASIDLAIRYSINPSAVDKIYREYRSQENLVNRALLNDVRSAIRDKTVNFSTTSMRQERDLLSQDIMDDLDKRWAKLGVIVDSVDLRNIGYPQEIEDSLKQVQTALNNVERAKAELETARVEAEKIKTEAQAQSDADQIIRCGATSTTTTEMVNGKEIKVIKVIPVPSEKCQNRLNEQVLTAKYIEMLRQAAAQGNTVYVIPPDTNSLLNLGGATKPSPSAAPQN